MQEVWGGKIQFCCWWLRARRYSQLRLVYFRRLRKVVCQDCYTLHNISAFTGLLVKVNQSSLDLLLLWWNHCFKISACLLSSWKKQNFLFPLQRCFLWVSLIICYCWLIILYCLFTFITSSNHQFIRQIKYFS